MTEQTTVDPREILDREPMRIRQFIAVAVCVLLNALDGFDVLSISFASPGIAQEWGIDRAALGVVLSMELFGMAAGSFLLGPVADRVGRRPTAMACLSVMALGMIGAAFAGSITMLAALRFATGIGIGGMLACTNALVAEYANKKWRGTAVAIMAAGYPMGAIAGGAFASSLLVDGNWRDVFIFGGIATATLLPIVYFLAPESVAFLARRNPPDSLNRINRSMKALGHAPFATLPEVERDESRRAMPVRRLFEADLRLTTLLLTGAYFCHIMTFYFIIKWIPKIVFDMGFSPASAGGVLVYANMGGLAGALLFSALAMRIRLVTLILGTLLLSTVLVTLFGAGQANLSELALAAAAAGFFTNAGVVGFYALIASRFPTEVRAGGTGFVIGIGRGGAAMGPVVAGILFEAGIGLQGVAAGMALGPLLAAAAIRVLPKNRPA